MCSLRGNMVHQRLLWRGCKGLLRLYRRILNLVLDWLCRLVYTNEQASLPAISEPLVLESATALAAKIRNRKLKSIHLVETYASRIGQVNPIVNCVVDQRLAEALKDAQAADELVASGVKSTAELAHDLPFLGVPFSVKDSVAVKGMIQTVGLVSRKGIRAEKDSDVVALLRQAGAIPLVITNVPELLTTIECSNNLHGTTKNPYDTRRIPGGSSGGEGCLISAAGSVFGIGTDIGGSIRIPAFCCGIFGHKPSSGAVSNEGLYPPTPPALMPLLGTGPMCRHATDLLPLLTVMAGPYASQLKLDRRVNLRTLKMYYIEDDGGNPWTTPLHPEMREAHRKVLEHFRKAYGIKPQRVTMPKLRHWVNIWLSSMACPDAPGLAARLADGNGEKDTLVELLKWCVGCSQHTFPAILLATMERLFAGGREGRRQKYLKMGRELKREFQELLGDDSVVLCPSFPEPAMYRNQFLFRLTDELYFPIFNVLGLPVTQCPLGLGRDGLPLGLQVVAGANDDHLTLAVAVEIEKAFGGWVPPVAIL